MESRCVTMVDLNFDTHPWASQKTPLLVLCISSSTTFEPQNSALVEVCGSARDLCGSKTYRLVFCNLDPHLTLLKPVFCPYVWPPENDLRLVVSPEAEQSIHPLDGVQQWQTFIVLDPDGKRHMTFSPTTVNIDTTVPRSKDFCARTLYMNEDTTSFP
jgi:hypothetical protein